MASIKQKSERKYKIIVCNGYRQNGSKISRAQTIVVPNNIPKKRIAQYVMHEAEVFEREFKYGFSEDADTPFEAFAESWLERQVRYRASTLAGYRMMLRRMCPIIGGVRLRDIKPITLENLAKQMRTWQHRGQPVSENTVQKYMNTVSAVLQDATRNDIIPRNPARRVQLPVVEQKQQFIPSKSEMFSLLCAFKQQSLIFRVFFILAVLTGCRRGELAALRWGDIQGNFIRVARSRSVVTGLGVVEGTTKNGKTRFVPLHPHVRNMLLNDILPFYDDETNPITPDDYVFARHDRKPIHPDTFSKRFKALVKEFDLDDRWHLHTLRHFNASLLLSEGISNKVVADLLGHRDTAFLEKTYGHAMPEYLSAAATSVTEFVYEASDAGIFCIPRDEYFETDYDELGYGVELHDETNYAS